MIDQIVNNTMNVLPMLGQPLQAKTLLKTAVNPNKKREGKVAATISASMTYSKLPDQHDLRNVQCYWNANMAPTMTTIDIMFSIFDMRMKSSNTL